MILTNSKISALVEWFEQSNYLFLCLLVAGDFNDYKFLKNIFDHKEILHSRSGETIAIFLFFDGQDTSVTIKNPNDGAYGSILPGEVIMANIESVSNYKIEEENNLRRNVIRQSLLISNEIQNFFDIPYSDIPCILLLEKSDLKSKCIIPTKGEITVETFGDFLIQLNQMINEFPNLKKINNKIELYNKRHSLEKKWNRIQKTYSYNAKEIEKSNSELLPKIELLIKQLVNAGLSSNLANQAINENTISSLWELPTKSLIKDAFNGEELKLLEEVLHDDSFREIASKVIMLARMKEYFINKQEIVKNSLKEIQEEVDGITGYTIPGIKEEIQIASEELKKLKVKIDHLEKKYKNKFWKESKFRPIKDFMLNIVSFSKNAKDILSLQESVKKLLE